MPSNDREHVDEALDSESALRPTSTPGPELQPDGKLQPHDKLEPHTAKPWLTHGISTGPATSQSSQPEICQATLNDDIPPSQREPNREWVGSGKLLLTSTKTRPHHFALRETRSDCAPKDRRCHTIRHEQHQFIPKHGYFMNARKRGSCSASITSLRCCRDQPTIANAWSSKLPPCLLLLATGLLPKSMPSSMSPSQCTEYPKPDASSA